MYVLFIVYYYIDDVCVIIQQKACVFDVFMLRYDGIIVFNLCKNDDDMLIVMIGEEMT